MSSIPDLTGHVIADRFEILRGIGQGGMGAVFEAKHCTLPRRFAIKILRPDLSRNSSFVQRFRREAIAVARIEHPNVVYITDFGESPEGLVFLVMEYLEGEGLDALLARNMRLPVMRAVSILIQVADAAHHAHREDVIHRDLKPENILLTEVRGQRDFVKVLDFGIAKMGLSPEAPEALTVPGQVFGTAEYMSPEQASGASLDGRSDIYAIGCLAYEMIAGNPPFLGLPMRVLRAHLSEEPPPPSSRLRDAMVPTALDAVVLRCLAKDPAQRYPDGEALRRDLLKVRATLMGMSQSMAQGTAGPLPPKADSPGEGWGPLRAPEMPEMFAELPSGPWAGAWSPEGSGLEGLRDDYEEALRELGLALVRHAIASTDVSDILERLLVIEEEVASLSGTIALSEQGFDRLRFEFGQREKRLRSAAASLGASRAQVLGRLRAQGSSGADLQREADDLQFQIEQLHGRCQEVSDECRDQIRELDAELGRYRTAREEREAEAERLYEALHQKVEALRSDEVPEGSYDRLDAIVDALSTAGRRRAE